jgi:hypothetical protein
MGDTLHVYIYVLYICSIVYMLYMPYMLSMLYMLYMRAISLRIAAKYLDSSNCNMERETKIDYTHVSSHV